MTAARFRFPLPARIATGSASRFRLSIKSREATPEAASRKRSGIIGKQPAVSAVAVTTDPCLYFVGRTSAGRCARCNELFRAHVDRAARQPMRPKYVPLPDDEDEP